MAERSRASRSIDHSKPPHSSLVFMYGDVRMAFLFSYNWLPRFRYKSYYNGPHYRRVAWLRRRWPLILTRLHTDHVAFLLIVLKSLSFPKDFLDQSFNHDRFALISYHTPFSTRIHILSAKSGAYTVYRLVRFTPQLNAATHFLNQAPPVLRQKQAFP